MELSETRVGILKKVVKVFMNAAGLKLFYKKVLVSKPHLDLYISAITHVSKKNILSSSFSHNMIFNFLGQKMLDLDIAFFPVERDVNINSVEWLTRIKITLQSSIIFSRVFKNMGIEIGDLLIYDPEFLKGVFFKKDQVWENMVENMCISIIGCIMYILMTDCGLCLGSCTEFSKRIFSYFVSKIDFKMTFHNVFDPFTRLKNIYIKEGLDINKMITKKEIRNPDSSIQFDYSVKFKNASGTIMLAQESGTDHKTVKTRLFKNAIDTLVNAGYKGEFIPVSSFKIDCSSNYQRLEDFQIMYDFIMKMFLQTGLTIVHASEILDYLPHFIQAFTHKSMNKYCNYEMFEFLGDTVVNVSMFLYMRDRWPKIKNMAWIKKIYDYITSKPFLSKLSKKYGLANFARYSNVEDMVTLYEDIFESFFGCITFVTEFLLERPRGCAIQLSFDIIKNIMDLEDIDISFENLFDPVSILKEIYDSNTIGLKWPSKNNEMFVTNSSWNDNEVKVYAWITTDPNSSGEPLQWKSTYVKGADIRNGRIVIATEHDKDPKIAQKKALFKAINILETKYGIYHISPDPTRE